MNVSIIIRTLNESKYLDKLLANIKQQKTDNLDFEVVLVDSGSIDETLNIAKQHNCKIIHISREDFSFGRSLNKGCKAASGDIFIMISGHCIPGNVRWIQELCQPLIDNKAVYSYGRQIGGPDSYYSECRIFNKYFPKISQIPQKGFYCNNANSAINLSAWLKHGFDEELTGLEDMALAKKLVNEGDKIAYVAQASVYHYHDEQWNNIKRRFERESIALQEIMPQIHIRKRDLVRYIISSVWKDWVNAWIDGLFFKKFIEVVQYRFFQYWGSYIGNNEHRKLSHVQKEEYFFPK